MLKRKASPGCALFVLVIVALFVCSYLFFPPDINNVGAYVLVYQFERSEVLTPMR